MSFFATILTLAQLAYFVVDLASQRKQLQSSPPPEVTLSLLIFANYALTIQTILPYSTNKSVNCLDVVAFVLCMTHLRDWRKVIISETILSSIRLVSIMRRCIFFIAPEKKQRFKLAPNAFLKIISFFGYVMQVWLSNGWLEVAA